MIPEEVRQWLESQSAPFTIFVTQDKEIILVVGDTPLKVYMESLKVPELPR